MHLLPIHMTIMICPFEDGSCNDLKISISGSKSFLQFYLIFKTKIKFKISNSSITSAFFFQLNSYTGLFFLFLIFPGPTGHKLNRPQHPLRSNPLDAKLRVVACLVSQPEPPQLRTDLLPNHISYHTTIREPLLLVSHERSLSYFHHLIPSLRMTAVLLLGQSYVLFYFG